jgi:hypothetical protein
LSFGKVSLATSNRPSLGQPRLAQSFLSFTSSSFSLHLFYHMILLPGAAGSSESKLLPPHQPRDSKPTALVRHETLPTKASCIAHLTTTTTSLDTTEHHSNTTTEHHPETATKLKATKQVITTNFKLSLPCAKSPSLCTPANTISSTS